MDSKLLQNFHIRVWVNHESVLFAFLWTNRKGELLFLQGKLGIHTFFVSSCIQPNPFFVFFDIHPIESMIDQNRCCFVI